MQTNRRELATVLAALRFWQRWGPKKQGGFFDRLDCTDQDWLDSIRTDAGRFESDLSVDEIDALCERLNIGSDGDAGDATGDDRVAGWLVVDSRGHGPEVCTVCNEEVEEWKITEDGRLLCPNGDENRIYSIKAATS